MSWSRLSGVAPGRIGIFAGWLAGQPAPVQRRLAAQIEAQGLATLWYGEAVGREAFAQAAVYLSATTRLVVASGIANIWVRDPAAMAAGGRTLAEAWPGRFVLGIGVSHRPLVNARGHDYARPWSAMNGYLDGMAEAAWRGPEAPMPPVVLAALGPRMVALARDRAAGAYPYFTTADHVREVRSIMGDEPFLAADLPVAIAASRTEARRIGDTHMRRYLALDNYRNNLLRLGWSEADVNGAGSEALFDAVVAWGDVAAIGARVDAMLGAGADQVVLNLLVDAGSLTYPEVLTGLAPLTRG